jgi:hypothetical protein
VLDNEKVILSLHFRQDFASERRLMVEIKIVLGERRGSHQYYGRNKVSE